jgi:hypothetical protein
MQFKLRVRDELRCGLLDVFPIGSQSLSNSVRADRYSGD